MAFFDQKQEVIRVELTTYGRYLLSLGKLRPAMYAFFDDDITYDNSYYSTLSDHHEDQNEIEDRILKGSLYRHPQTNFSGVETSIKRQKRMRKSQNFSRPGTEMVAGNPSPLFASNEQHELERDFSLGMPLGKTSVYNDEPPTFRLMTLAGEINSVSSSMEDEIFGNSYRIPQINIDIEYDITAHFLKDETKEALRSAAATRSRHVTFSPTFGDGSYLKIEGKHVLVSLEEKNIDISLNNFEVEVLEETTEVIRVPRRDAHGNVYTAREKRVSYTPRDFDPYTNALVETSNVARYEDNLAPGEFLQTVDLEENLNEPMPYSVEAIFNVSTDNQLSVPVGALVNAITSRVETANSLSQGSSMFLRKPLLRIPINDPTNPFSHSGPLSSAEQNIYSAGMDLPGDSGEDCDDEPPGGSGSGGYM